MSDNSPVFPTTRAVLVACLSAALLCCTPLLAGCSAESETGLELTGSFVDEVVTVSVPALPVSDVDLAVGGLPSTESTPGLSPGDQIATAIAPESPALPMVPAPQQSWHRITEVPVRPGDLVVAGQVLAVLDTGPSEAAIQAAEADLDRAEADLGVLDKTSQDIAQSRSDAASQTVALQRTILDLQSQRVDLQRQLDSARTSIAPPSLPSTATPPANVVAQIAQLEAAIERIDTGIEEAQDGIERLAEAQTSLTEVEGVIGSVKRTAAAVVDGRRVVVELTKAQRDRATVTAPVDGVVIDAPGAGEVLAAGAPLVRLRTQERPLLRTYLTAEQAQRVREGSSARVSLDSMPGTEYTGLVTSIGDEYVFVPTTFATRVIHLTRGFEVTIEVYGAPELPAGTPADLVVQTD